MWKQQAALNSTMIDAGSNLAPEWVELIPAGEVVGRDGRRWTNHNPSAIIQAFETGGMDLPVDLEHATELKASKGEAAPAVGWVKTLKAMEGAIWGRVLWNETGRRLIVSRQYRYLSPVILYEKSSGGIAGLTSVALTNRPNLRLQALNHQAGVRKPVSITRALNADESMICARLGVSEDEFLKTDPTSGYKRSSLSSLYANTMSADERMICERIGISEEEYLKVIL